MGVRIVTVIPQRSSVAHSRNQRSLRKQIIQSLGFRKEIRVLLASGKAQDRTEIAAQHNGQFPAVRHQCHLIHQRAERLGGLGTTILVLQVFIELANPLCVQPGHVRMHQGRGFVGIGKLVGKLRLPGF